MTPNHSALGTAFSATLYGIASALERATTPGGISVIRRRIRKAADDIETSLRMLHITPVYRENAMNIDEAVARACEEKTLSAALQWIAVWETERVVRQAIANHEKGPPYTDTSHGGKWDTCFGPHFDRVLATWSDWVVFSKDTGPDSGVPVEVYTRYGDHRFATLEVLPYHIPPRPNRAGPIWLGDDGCRLYVGDDKAGHEGAVTHWRPRRPAPAVPSELQLTQPPSRP